MMMSLLLLAIVLVAAAPQQVRVRFDVKQLNQNAVGSFVVTVTPSLAPLGAKRFFELVNDGFFNDVATGGITFFRCVPQFVVQFGISGNTTTSAYWANRNIADDPVLASNILGTISYATAGPNTRTTQLFINLADNSFLDSQGFAPFANVTSGWNIVQNIYMAYAQLPDQGQIESQGYAYLHANFPLLSYISSAKIL